MIDEVIEYWRFRYDRAKDFYDIHWEADERREQYLENLIEMSLDDICVMKNLLKRADKMKE